MRTLLTLMIGLLMVSSFACRCDDDLLEVCAEWIHVFPYTHNVGDKKLAQLKNREDVATGFYEELQKYGCEGEPIRGGPSAWESDFKLPLSATDVWVDTCDIVLHAGHGRPGGFYFGSQHQDCLLESTEAIWGTEDLEWLILDDCSCLSAPGTDTGEQALALWKPAFRGLHLICGFATTAHDWDTRGRSMAEKLRKGWTFVQAWYYACEMSEAKHTAAAVMGADPSESESPYYDKLPNPNTPDDSSFICADPDPTTWARMWRETHDCD